MAPVDLVKSRKTSRSESEEDPFMGEDRGGMACPKVGSGIEKEPQERDERRKAVFRPQEAPPGVLSL